jgi:hypothetical protein
MVEFPCYQRAAHTLPLRLKVGGEQINLEVHNPQPIEPSVWAAHPLPQTNIVNGYRYAFTKRWGSRVAIGVRRNVPHAPALGWCSMRLTTVDPWGNWQAGRPGRLGSGLFFPILPTQSGVWKLLTETDEYLSAGLMGEGPDNLHHVMPLNSRLRELGVQLVLFTSGGAFAITNASLPTATPAGWVAATNDFVTLRPVRGNGDWLVSLATRQPAILLVADAEIPLRARLRERIGADDGRIFRTYEIARHTARIQGRVWSATLYNPHVPSDARSLEVEIIHRLPQAEFYIYQDF